MSRLVGLPSRGAAQCRWNMFAHSKHESNLYTRLFTEFSFSVFFSENTVSEIAVLG